MEGAREGRERRVPESGEGKGEHRMRDMGERRKMKDKRKKGRK